MIKRFLISIIAFSIVTVFLLWLTGNLSKVGAFLLTSRIEVDFDKGGNRFVKEVAPYPKEVIDNKEYERKIIDLANKKMKSLKEENLFLKKQKVIQHITQKGFESELTIHLISRQWPTL